MEDPTDQSALMEAGYAHADYAHAFSDVGQPRALRASGGWLLARPIEDVPHHDLMGCYPIFACRHWGGLGADLEALAAEGEAGPICVSMVTDPFGQHEPSDLSRWFPDICRAYKQHFVVDLDQDLDTRTSSHHRRNARKALSAVEVDHLPQPLAHLDEWIALYDVLVARHGIRGIAAFSKSSFQRQLQTPGMTAFRATHAGETVGMVLWYVHGDSGYYHLGAYSDKGYELKASYAIFWTAMTHFSGEHRWLSLGAGAGVQGDAHDGLNRFKKGWSTDTRTAWFCGRIFRKDLYHRLTDQRNSRNANFFPAYRAGEFG